MARSRRRPWLAGSTVAVVSIALITIAIYGLREVMPVVSTGVAYLLAVLLVSSYWGLWLGLFTSVASTAVFNFFHIPPTDRFTVADGENWVALGVFFVAAIVTSTLAEASRARAREAEQGRRDADLTADMARVLLGSSTAQGALAAVADRIAAGFGLRSVEVGLGWHSPDEDRRVIPLIVGRQRAGTVLVPRETSKETIAALEDRVVPALEALVGAAQQREALEAQLIETETLRRSDVVKTTLLRSVSHDLHSPITAIAAAAEALASDALGEDGRRELVSIVSTESGRLERLVRNLLDLSRLESGAARPRSDWVSVEEIVHAAVAAARAPRGGFDIAVDGDVPLIRADAAQLERALANIADNAARYAGDEPVEVRARLAGARVVVQVSDRGPGIPGDQLAHIFDPFHRADDGSGGGSGLGLAIARGFVEANNGTVHATSRAGGGSTFTVGLPAPRERRDRDQPTAVTETLT